jgi:hypothetical protein
MPQLFPFRDSFARFVRRSRSRGSSLYAAAEFVEEVEEEGGVERALGAVGGGAGEDDGPFAVGGDVDF